MEIDAEINLQLKKDIARAIVVILCLVALFGLAALRFQRVTIQNWAAHQTNCYWRVLLPGQKHKVQLPPNGNYATAEYNLKGLYGLLKVERHSVVRVPWTNTHWSLPLSDPSIEAAERINLLQKQGSVRRMESRP